ncbi:hypothetical protein GCM10010191_89500 [Actinomadura vinacea]|uniref:Uncharacterized protein n=1 Tax=Actinomadura vinacea TaxID=115336 RepID=A0ABN3KD00_9ACTN
MSPIYPGDLVRYRIGWEGVPSGTEAEFLGQTEGTPGAFTVAVELTGGGPCLRVPLLCLEAVSPREPPVPQGDVQDHILPSGVRVSEGSDPRTRAPRWSWIDPHTADQRRLIWNRDRELTEYRIVGDGPEIPTGTTIPTGPTRPQAHDVACGFFERRASAIPEPPYVAEDGYAWIRALPSRPLVWRPLVVWEGASLGRWPDAVVAVCRAPQGQPLFAASGCWHAGAVKVTNHTTRAGLRARLLQVKKELANA